jgi:hypothetical protein
VGKLVRRLCLRADVIGNGFSITRLIHIDARLITRLCFAWADACTERPASLTIAAPVLKSTSNFS